MRKIIRQQRRKLSAPQRLKAGKKILCNLLKHNILRYKKVAIYTAFDGEVETTYIIEFLKKYGTQIYLPVLFGEKLMFARMNNKTTLNTFNIPEPVSPPIHPKKINIIITPLVGFDENNNRMGMGGGFYDKTFAFKQRQKSFHYPKLFGLAYQFQKIKITPNPWDIPLDAVVIAK